MTRRWAVAALIVVVAVGAATRVALSRVHFAHVDDIGVASAILSAKSHPPSADDLLQTARDKYAAGSTSPRVALLLELERRGLWRPLHAMTAAVYPFVVVPLTFTYAPLQFLVTAPLLDPADGYQRVKFLGRLPSVGFSVLAIAIVALTARRLGAGGATMLAAVAAALLACSGEHTTIAALMYSYAATSAASAAVLLLTAVDARRRGWPARFVATRSLILSALLYLSYQTVMLLPGYFAALGLGALRRSARPDRPRLALQGALLVAVVGLAFLPAYLFRVAGIAAINYNAGPAGEFVFRPRDGALTALGEAPRFLLVNSWIAVKALVPPVPDESPAAAVAAAVVVLGLLIGLWRMVALALRSRAWRAAAAVGIYTAVTLVLFLTLVLAGQLAIGPTRHLVVYLPIVVVASAYGLRTGVLFVCARRTWARPGTLWGAVAGASVALLLWAYVGYAPRLFAERRDRFDERRIQAMARDYRVDLVVADTAEQLRVMPSLMREAPVLSTGDAGRTPSRAAGVAPRPQRILVVSQFEAFTEPVCLRVQALLIGRSEVDPRAPCLSRVRTVYSVASPSDVEVEFSRRTRNGTNGFYASVIEFVSPQPALRVRGRARSALFAIRRFNAGLAAPSARAFVMINSSTGPRRAARELMARRAATRCTLSPAALASAAV